MQTPAQGTMEKNMATIIKKPGDPFLHFPEDENASSRREVEGAGKQRREPERPEREHSIHWHDIIRIAFVAAAAAALWYLKTGPISFYTGIGVVCAAVGGYAIFREAIENVLERRMTMELSMTIAILAALVIREFFTALVITLFVLVAEVLEGLTVGRGRRAIRHLIDLLPGRATVRRGGVWMEVESRQVVRGEIILVKPGGRIPVDGSVEAGHSFVDQATITGESLPVEKLPGATVFAGTINQSGALEIRAEHLGRDTTFGKIIDAVERAEKSRAPIQKTADRLAGYLVYFAIASAALTFLLTHNVRSTISVIIVAGACGIAAGTPLAILGGIGRAAHHGAIVKGGLYIERLAEVDTILLDKTGTLTYGIPEVEELRPAPGVSRESLLRAAAVAESHSEHPLARAVLRKTSQLGLEHEDPEGFEYIPGRGVMAHFGTEEILVGSRSFLEGRGVQVKSLETSDAGSEIFVARRGQFLGSLVISERLRSEARQAVQSLKLMGLRTVLLTGDTKAAAERVGKELGVEEVAFELLPEGKLEYVMRLSAAGRTVAMVGDGVNDAPALMQAAVGVAMGSGTDVARESAEIVLIGNDLSKLVETLRIARRCRRTILQNFIGTLGVDGVGMGLAAFGLLNPLLAAFIHVSSEMVFILNSARLVPRASLAGALGRGPRLVGAQSWEKTPREEASDTA
jgi:Cd2+/Zn2+-exporting ATPase/Cu+-exporting ATPase